MQQQLEELTGAIYQAALEPAAWADVMVMMKRCFRSTGEAFYFLDFEPRKARRMHLGGISDAWYDRFDAAYFTPDNPWVMHSRTLHRPGVIRTNERLARYTGDPQILYRSAYYNEWMRPQAFRHTIGNTMLSEDGTVANITLLRPGDMGTYTAHEVRTFERVSGHLTRALRMALRLEGAIEQRDRSARVFDELLHGLAIVDPHGKLLYANAAAEALLSCEDGVHVKAGMLCCRRPDDQLQLEALFRASLAPADARPAGPGRALVHRTGGRTPLEVSAIRVAPGQARYLANRTAILLTIVDPSLSPPNGTLALRKRYQMTPAEARLAQALAAGASLKQAAETLGITYTTARSYLKILFQKTGTHRQAQLVAQLLVEKFALH